jgi:hypothetical protein
MRRITDVAKRLPGSILGIALLLSPMYASGARDFAGQYRVTNAIESAGSISATIDLRFFNFSGTDISNATITVKSPLDPGASYLSTTVPMIAAGKDFNQRSIALTLPAAEYKRWVQGASPYVVISYTNTSGKSARAVIELVRLP